MTSVDLIFTEVSIPLTQENINKLGEDHGITMYIVKVWKKYQNGDTVFDTVSLKIDRCHDGSYTGCIDGIYFLTYSDWTIYEICKLNF